MRLDIFEILTYPIFKLFNLDSNIIKTIGVQNLQIHILILSSNKTQYKKIFGNAKS